MKKMILTVIPLNLADITLESLARAGFTATYLESRGGVMHQTKRLLFIAVDQEQEEKVAEIIRRTISDYAHTIKPAQENNGFVSVDSNIGGTVIFSWEIDRFETI